MGKGDCWDRDDESPGVRKTRLRREREEKIKELEKRIEYLEKTVEYLIQILNSASDNKRT